MAVVRRIRAVAPLAALGLLLAVAAPAHAAAPANDAFAAPVTITEGAGGVLFDNVGSTSELSEPDAATYGEASDCGAIGDRTDCGSTVWFRFTPTTTGNYTIGTCDAGTDVDTVLNVYTGATLATLAPVVFNDDACPGGPGGNGSRVTFSATAGTPYSLQVEGYADVQGAFYLRADPGTPAPTPANDTSINRLQSVADAFIPIQSDGVHSGPRASATFSFGADNTASTFECSLDGSAFAGCTSPVSYDDVAADGSQHTFLVRATAASVTDPTPAAERFTIDSTPPDTSFGPTPADGSSTTNPVNTTLGTTERSVEAAFRCGSDGTTFDGTCPATPSFTGFCDGPHTINAAAIDDAFNVDPTPATRSITITGGSACAAPVLGAPSVTLFPNVTGVSINAALTSGGNAGVATLTYGTTTAYGETERSVTAPNTGGASFIALGLTPNTLYRYAISVTTGSGTATTGDQTFTTGALPGGDALPNVTVGTPVLVGRHAARIPVTTDVGSPAANTNIEVDFGDPAHPGTYPFAVSALANVPSSTTGQVTVPVDLVDLKPSTTYHYRVLVRATYGVLTEDRSFTTPAPPAPPTPPTTTTTTTTTPVTTTPAKPIVITIPKAFKLAKGQVTIAKVTRRSRVLTVKVKGAPKKTKLVVTFKGLKTLATARRTTLTTGTTTFRIKLSAKARKALRSKKLKRVKFVVAATPPLQKRSSVTITKTLPK